jgi:transcription-repair coupling factor (superfamily II helicase)
VPSLVQTLEPLAAREPGLQAVARAAAGGGPCLLRGVGAGRAYCIARLCLSPGCSLLVLTYSPERARGLADDARELLAGEEIEVLYYPEVASALYDGVLPPPHELAQRLRVLDRLATGKPSLVVAPVQAVLHLTTPHQLWTEARFDLRCGQAMGRDALVDRLLALGYQRISLVEAPGQLAARGGIVDFFPPTLPHPVRVEFFGEEIDSLRSFEPDTQRSLVPLKEVAVAPAVEILLTTEAAQRARPILQAAFERELDRLYQADKRREADRLRQRMHEDLRALEALAPTPQLLPYGPYLYPQPSTLLDYLPAGAVLVVDEPARVEQAAEEFERDLATARQAAAKLGAQVHLSAPACMSFAALVGRYLKQSPWRERAIYLSLLRPQVSWEPDLAPVEINFPPPESFGGCGERLVEGLRAWTAAGRIVLICTRQAAEEAAALRSRGLSEVEPLPASAPLQAGRVYVAEAELAAGFVLPAAQLVVLTSRELFGWQKIRRGDEATYQPGFSLSSLRELNEGDYVVHIHHGIGIYRGLRRETIDGVDREYLVIEYAGQDRLHVPVTQLDRIQKYVGPEGRPPALHSLQSRRWAQQKRRARRSALLLAQELLRLYQAREQARRPSFVTDSPWLDELEASFRYEETPDQLRALADLKADLAADRPADRLICGDVGFGKTEVAIRAAFLAVLNGKQVAVLVPTTVLAEQHYHTFAERLAPYPVRVEMLSRFKSPAEQRRIVEGLRQGSVDIVIGTHRLLMSDVRFQDLGLLIIDEEQRFGVEHKERLKKLRPTVDVITLTATPIPRTLNMALSGIRDISVINDPPRGRLPVRTYVRERDEQLIREAIQRELARQGQVYFVHNRVASIRQVAAQVQRLVPAARVAIAHGQMPEDELEQVMLAFFHQQVDVLVCTTIVQNGLDVPNANTLIVDDADRLGLAQLYQLRGRIGRSDRQAYAYLLYRYPHLLTEDAERRLRAIEEFAELGSGLKVALRDLEIRGAGNLLGPEQSGHLAAVGLDLFCEMLAESVKTLRGHVEPVGARHPTIDLPLRAIIPERYLPDERQRIAAYRRLGAAQTEAELAASVAELEDRFGRLPPEVDNLVRLARLRIQCGQAGITEVAWRAGKVHVILDDRARLTSRECHLLMGLYRPRAGGERGGAVRPLPQFYATEHEVSFAADRSQPQQLLAMTEEVVGRLVDRARAAHRARRDQAAQPA